jgi:phosphoribosylaminoimidazole (AIR) synthetase
MGDSIYGSMGVDAHKGAVVNTFKPIIDNIYPHAFVNITRDSLAPGYVRTLNVDGDGSKPTQHCLHFLETGDAKSFEPTADDTFVMVAADGGAAGFVREILFADVLDLNKFPIPGLKEAVMSAYKRRISEIIELHRQYGFFVEFFGGETADLPSQVTSYVANGFSYSRVQEKLVIRGDVQPGDLIWGFSSGGRAVWEEKLNSFLMCNGVTLACAVIMWEGYNQKYPFLRYDKQKYRGRFKVDDKPDGLEGMTASEALRSPTRQWAIVFRLLIDELIKREALHLLHGLTVNTGGGASKVLRLGKDICFFKEMPSWPPLFQLIHEEGGVPPREMNEDFNCGVGADIIGSNEGGILEEAIRTVSSQTKIDYWHLGECYRWSKGSGNHVVLNTPLGSFTYPGEK